MAEDFRADLDALAKLNGAALRAIVERAETSAYGEDWSDLTRSGESVGAPAPKELLSGRVITPEDVARAIDHVEHRWRLDVIMALDDYLD